VVPASSDDTVAMDVEDPEPTTLSDVGADTESNNGQSMATGAAEHCSQEESGGSCASGSGSGTGESDSGASGSSGSGGSSSSSGDARVANRGCALQ
jgi:hypothetical protein